MAGGRSGSIPGTIESRWLSLIGEEQDGTTLLRLALPEGLARYVVAKGSLAVDGVSLTVAAIDGDEVTIGGGGADGEGGAEGPVEQVGLAELRGRGDPVDLGRKRVRPPARPRHENVVDAFFRRRLLDPRLVAGPLRGKLFMRQFHRHGRLGRR